MKDILQRFAKLIDLKSIVTTIITIAFVYGFAKGKIEASDFMIIATMVYTFYFTKKKENEDEPK